MAINSACSPRLRAPVDTTRGRFAAQWRLHGRPVEDLDPDLPLTGQRIVVRLLPSRPFVRRSNHPRSWFRSRGGAALRHRCAGFASDRSFGGSPALSEMAFGRRCSSRAAEARRSSADTLARRPTQKSAPRTSGRSHRSGCRTVARLETTARVLLAAPAGKSHGRSWLRRSRGPAIARAPSFGDGPVSPPCRRCLGPPAIRSNLVELPATRLDGPRTARQILNHPQGNGPERDRCVGARQVPSSLAL
jgi:hypothetical protein